MNNNNKSFDRRQKTNRSFVTQTLSKFCFYLTHSRLWSFFHTDSNYADAQQQKRFKISGLRDDGSPFSFVFISVARKLPFKISPCRPLSNSARNQTSCNSTRFFFSSLSCFFSCCVNQNLDLDLSATFSIVFARSFNLRLCVARRVPLSIFVATGLKDNDSMASGRSHCVMENGDISYSNETWSFTKLKVGMLTSKND